MVKQTDAAAEVDAQGNLTNMHLHEQMTAGVNDHDFRMKTKKFLREKGVDEKVLDSVLS